MNHILKIIFVVLGTTFANISLCVANPADYFGGNFINMDYESENFPSSSINLMSLTLGNYVDTYYRAELRIGYGLSDRKVNYNGSENTYELDRYVGAYIKYGLHFDEDISPYIITGVTHSKTKQKTGGSFESISDASFSYGLGVEFSKTKTSSFNLEYVNYNDGDKVGLNGISLGYNHSF
ncbi:MAG: porin family protein [Gammaproteobacteria bacterium]|nr:porin family protein [Gammaproteobacteria bacterium]